MPVLFFLILIWLLPEFLLLIYIMKWNLLKSGSKRKTNNLRAYDDIFLSRHQNKKPQQIIEDEITRKLNVVSKIADQGSEEKNQLKAAVSWLRFSRQLSEVQKLEIEGSLTLESRLTEALEKAGDETKGTKECW